MLWFPALPGPQPPIWTRAAGRGSTLVPTGKTVPGEAYHLSCIKAAHLPPAPTGSLGSPSPRLRTAATPAFPSSQPSPVPGFTAVISCFDAFGR